MKEGKKWIITGKDAMDYNEPGEKPKVTIKEKTIKKISDILKIQPISINLFSIQIENEWIKNIFRTRFKKLYKEPQELEKNLNH